MLPLLVLTVMAAGPAATIEAQREAIGVVIGVRCPKALPDEIVVCGRTEEREKLHYRLPLATPPAPGTPGREAVYEERNRMLDLGKGGTESPVGPGGESGRNLNALKRRMDRNEGHNLLAK